MSYVELTEGRSLLTPFDVGEAKRARDRLYLKEVLPQNRTINYKGRPLSFSRSDLDEFVRSFKASDEPVPLVLATEDNSHPPEEQVEAHSIGTVRALHAARQGLYALVEAREGGNLLLRKHPKIGVSCSIDPVARKIRHVCATVRPRYRGMRPWQPVNLTAGRSAAVIDLSESDYEALSEARSRIEQSARDLEELREREALLRWRTGDDEVPKRPVPLAPDTTPEEQQAIIAWVRGKDDPWFH